MCWLDLGVFQKTKFLDEVTLNLKAEDGKPQMNTDLRR